MDAEVFRRKGATGWGSPSLDHVGAMALQEPRLTEVIRIT